jgi:hypothetical protein
MATFSVKQISQQDGSVLVAEWLNITEADTSLPEIEMAEYGDRSVHIWGTFGGGTLSMVGRNSQSANQIVLVDPQGNAINATTEKLEQLLELTRFACPKIAGATGASVNVAMVLRRANSMRT